jgi:hypothetical protein
MDKIIGLFLVSIFTLANAATADEFRSLSGLQVRLEMRNGFINKRFGGIRVNTTKNRYITMNLKQGDIETYTFCSLSGVVFTVGSDDGLTCERHWSRSAKDPLIQIVGLRLTRSIEPKGQTFALDDIVYLDEEMVDETPLRKVLGSQENQQLELVDVPQTDIDSSVLALSAHVRDTVKNLVDVGNSPIRYSVSRKMELSLAITRDDDTKSSATVSILNVPGKPSSNVAPPDVILARLRKALGESR